MSKSNSSGGIDFAELLTILFIGLKLTHQIDWPWVWVLSPAWIPLAMILLILLIVFLAVIIWEKIL